jgi:hypothetical protein
VKRSQPKVSGKVIAQESTTPQKIARCINQRCLLRFRMNVCARMSVHQAAGISVV